MTEDYVRPPLVAVEPPDPRVVTWRFRGVLIAVLAVIAVLIFFLARAIIDSGNSNPQVSPQSAPRPALTVARHVGR